MVRRDEEGEIAANMWTDEEDAQLRKLVEEHGMKKWAMISSKMESKGAKQCRR